MYYGLRSHSTELILFASRTAFAINAHLWASSFHHFLTFLWRSLTIELFMVVAMLMFIEAPTIIEAYCWLLQNPCPLSISWSLPPYINIRVCLCLSKSNIDQQAIYVSRSIWIRCWTRMDIVFFMLLFPSKIVLIKQLVSSVVNVCVCTAHCEHHQIFV